MVVTFCTIRPLLAQAKENDILSIELSETSKKVLLIIAQCESGNRHTVNGKVLRGRVNNLDIGLFQINLKYHKETAKKLGLNLFKRRDNYLYAKYLLLTQGLKPWSASGKCQRKMLLTI